MSERILLWLFRFLSTRGIPMVLIAVIAMVFVDSLTRAEWVSDSAPLTIDIFLGLIVGATLAGSSFKGWMAMGYTGILSTAVTLQEIGHIVPSIEEMQALEFSQLPWVMHLRLLVLSDRVFGWAAAFMKGENIKDTGLFILLAGLLVWNAGVWLVWSVARHQNAFHGLIPYATLLAVNIYLRGQVIERMWLFLLSGVLLVGYTAWTRQHREWEARGLDYPELLGADWAMSILLITLLVAPVARIAPLLGTPAGWQALSDLFHPAYQQVTDTSERLFSGVNPPTINLGRVSARAPDLSQIGLPVPTGDDVIMWVTTNDPAPPSPLPGVPSASKPQHYWASTVFGKYNGKGWDPIEASELTPSAGHLEDQLGSVTNGPPRGRYQLRQEFEILVPHGNTLFAASVPVSASEAVGRYSDGLLKGTVSKYQVTSYAVQMQASDLREAYTRYPPGISTIYLQLPASLPARVRNLAQRITGDAANPYEKARLIQDYLRLTYPYKLDAPPPPDDHDPVDYFLFDAPGGFCSYYASAMVVMLRTQGIPARVLSGYAMGEFDYKRGAYRVPAWAAHAWVQVYFPGFGWVEFEPTPAQRAIEYGEPDQAGASYSAPLTTRSPLFDSLSSFREVAAPMVVGLMFFLLAALGVWLSRGVLWGSGTPAQQTRQLYWHMRRTLAWVGIDSFANATPFEFLFGHSSSLGPYPRLKAALSNATGLYIRAMFSRDVPCDAEIKGTRRMWRLAAGDWLACGVRATLDLLRRDRGEK